MAKKLKEEVKQLTFEDLKVRHVYRAKKPKLIGLFSQSVDDRDIFHISQHKCVVGHVDHGYHQEFLDWCAKKTLRFPGSEIDQHEYYNETGKDAKNIETIWDHVVQYDSPSVKRGKKYPTMPMAKFLKWAAEDVTSKMPENGDWASSL